MDLIDIPVEGVTGGNDVRVGFILGAEERAAVEDGIVVGTEGFAHFLKELGVGGVTPVVSQTGEEPGAWISQSELKFIFADGLDAYVVPVGFGAAFKGHVVIFCADHVEQKVSSTGGVGGIKYPLGGGYPVLGLYVFAVFAAVVTLPLNAFADLEGPGQTVFALGPAFGKAGLAHTVVVVFNQGVYPVCPSTGRGGMQGVPVRYFIGVEQLDNLLGSSIFGPFGAGVVNYNIAVVRSGGRIVVTIVCRGIGGGGVGVGGLIIGGAACERGYCHYCYQQQCDPFLHCVFSFLFLSLRAFYTRGSFKFV